MCFYCMAFPARFYFGFYDLMYSQVQRLKKELGNAQKSRKAASASLRTALQKAAQLRLMEKEKNKSPSYAMRISLKITKVVWSMLIDGKSFAEAEINDLVCLYSLGAVQFFCRQLCFNTPNKVNFNFLSLSRKAYVNTTTSTPHQKFEPTNLWKPIPITMNPKSNFKTGPSHIYTYI